MFSFKFSKLIRQGSIFSLLVVNLLGTSAYGSDPGKQNSPPSPSTSPGRWAVVVGIGTFSSPELPKLRYANKDASDFANCLVRYNGFPADHVRLLQNENATKKDILNATTSWLPSVVKPDDVAILYIRHVLRAKKGRWKSVDSDAFRR